MTAIRLPSTPEPVVAWLRSLAPDAEAGKCRHARECVLANYLLALGATDPSVGTVGYLANWEDDEHIPIPQWAQDFIDRTDFMHATYEPLTAAEALAALTAEKEPS